MHEAIPGAEAWTPKPNGRMLLRQPWTDPESVGVGGDYDWSSVISTQDPNKALVFAQQQMGLPYSGPLSNIPGSGRFGDPGYDCSSFVSAAYRELGINLTPFTDAAAGQTQRIDEGDARPGDIVFYRYADPSQPGVSYPHMGIYLGNGQMVDASYNTGVSVRPLLNMPYEIRRAPGVPPAAVAQAAVGTAQQAASENPIASYARAQAQAYGVDPDIFARQIGQESGWRPGAESPAGARGIAQFMPGTAADVARRMGGGVTAQQIMSDPQVGLRAAAFHMRELLDRNGGDYARALAAYNAGQGAVDRYGGVPPFRETQEYLRRILQGQTPTRAEGAAPGAAPSAAGGRPGGPPPPQPRTEPLRLVFNGREIPPLGSGPLSSEDYRPPTGWRFSGPNEDWRMGGYSGSAPLRAEPTTPPPPPRFWPGEEQEINRQYTRQFGAAPAWQPEEEPWRESALGMMRAGQPLTTQQDWGSAQSRYEQEFGEPLDWGNYATDDDTYGYIESALGMARAETPPNYPEVDGQYDFAGTEEDEEETGWGQDVGAGGDARGTAAGNGNLSAGVGPGDVLPAADRPVLGGVAQSRPAASGIPGASVGVGADEWNPWSWVDLSGAYDVPFLGGLARGAEALGGGIFGQQAPQPSQLSFDEEERRRREYQQEYGWGNPWEYAQNTVRNAFEGTSDAYQIPVLGGAARVAGLGLNVLGDVGNLPWEAVQYAGGVLGGAGQMLTGEDRDVTYNYGALGGERTAFAPRDWADVFDPGAAIGRAEAALPPVLSFGANLIVGSKGVGELGDLAKAGLATSQAAARGERVAENLGEFGPGIAGRILDVPNRLGLQEDFGRLLGSEVVGAASLGAAGVGFGIGFAQGGGTENPDDWGQRFLKGAEYALPGIAGRMGLPHLGEWAAMGAERYRAVHYAEELFAPENRRLMELQDLRGAQALTFQETEELHTLLDTIDGARRAQYPSLNDVNLSPSSREQILSQLKQQRELDEAAITRQTAHFKPSEYPYLLRTQEQWRRMLTDSFAPFEDWVSHDRTIRNVLASPAALKLAGDEDVEGLFRAAANSSTNASGMIVGELTAPILHKGGINTAEKLDWYKGDFGGAIAAVDWVMGEVPDDVLMGMTRADYLRDIVSQVVAAPDLPTAMRQVPGLGAFRAEDVLPEGIKALGPLKTPRDAIENLYRAARDVDNKFDAGTAVQWFETAQREQDEYAIPLLRRMEEVGALRPGAVDDIAAKRGVYGAFEEIAEGYDEYRVHGWYNRTLLREGSGIGRAHTIENDAATSGARAYRKYEHSYSVIAQQEVHKALLGMSERNPDFARMMRPALDDEAMTARAATAATARQEADAAVGLPNWANLENRARELEARAGETIYLNADAAAKKLPGPGWAVYSALENGAPASYYMAEDLRNTFMAANPRIVDRAGQIVEKFLQSPAQLFRLGVTTFSMPFIMGNVPRDFQAVMQNSGYPGTVWRNYVWSAADVLSNGMDDFVRHHEGNPLLAALPQKISDSLHDLLDKKGGGSQFLEMYRQGGGTATLTSSLQRGRPEGAAAFGYYVPGQTIPGIGGIPVLGRTIETYADFMNHLSQSLEIIPRLAVFRAALEHGEDARTAGFAARSVTTDFSKGGELTKLLSAVFPLLNARMQGTLRSANAALEDPSGFATRLTFSSAIPAMALYAYNRTLYSDLYDSIPVAERNGNFIAVYGSVKDDRDPQGKERPLYLRIPKTEVTGMVANPIEHIMDTIFHIKHGEAPPLKDFQRTERSNGQMWLSQIASMLPISVKPQDMADMGAWANSALALSPIAGTLIQMGANRDYFFDRPIVPENQEVLPVELRYGEHGQAPWAARGLARLAKELNLPEGSMFRPAPAQIAFAVSHMGGTAASQILWAPDLVWDAFKAVGMPVPPQFTPNTIEDLGVPPGTSPEDAQTYLDAINSVDFRPWQVRFVGRLFGMGASQQSVQSKVAQMGRADQKIWNETRVFDEEYHKAGVEFDQALTRVQENPNLTHAEIADRTGKLRDELRGRRNQLIAEHPQALSDPTAKNAFKERIPGVSVNVEAFRPVNLPADAPIASLAARFDSPLGVVMSDLSPVQQEQARNQELQKMADEYNVPHSAMRDYIAAYKLNGRIPSIPLQDADFRAVVDDYKQPPALTGRNLSEVTSEEMYAQRRLVAQKAAQEYGIPLGDLLERIQLRLGGHASEASPTAISYEKALRLSAEIHDPMRYPKFADEANHPVGVPSEWDQWEGEIALWKARYPGEAGRRMWPGYVQELEQAKARADIIREPALAAHPYYYDYQAWFGSGRAMKTADWAGFVNGERPRYEDAPSMSEAARRDSIIRLYRTLPPNDPMKRELHFEYDRFRKLAVPGWASALEVDNNGVQYDETDELYRQLTPMM